MKEVLLDKDYDQNNLCDIERDVGECFDVEDVWGLKLGYYKVTVVYIEEEK